MWIAGGLGGRSCETLSTIWRFYGARRVGGERKEISISLYLKVIVRSNCSVELNSRRAHNLPHNR